MAPGILDAGSVSAHSLALDGAFVWLLLAFTIFAVGTTLWLMLGSLRVRFTREAVQCPIQGKRAELWVRRSKEGRPADVKSCSLMSPAGYVTCGRECLSRVGS